MQAPAFHISTRYGPLSPGRTHRWSTRPKKSRGEKVGVCIGKFASLLRRGGAGVWVADFAPPTTNKPQPGGVGGRLWPPTTKERGKLPDIHIKIFPLFFWALLRVHGNRVARQVVGGGWPRISHSPLARTQVLVLFFANREFSDPVDHTSKLGVFEPCGQS